MDIKSCPCKDCKKRTATCHGKCNLYSLWKNEVSYNKKEKDKQREAEYLYYEDLRKLLRNNRGGLKK